MQPVWKLLTSKFYNRHLFKGCFEGVFVIPTQEESQSRVLIKFAIPPASE